MPGMLGEVFNRHPEFLAKYFEGMGEEGMRTIFSSIFDKVFKDGVEFVGELEIDGKRKKAVFSIKGLEKRKKGKK